MSFTPAQMEARDEGADAFHEGKKRTENPYSLLSQKDLWTCWDDGWEEAETEDANDEDDEDDDGGVAETD
jgi:hypothetical protein